MDRFVVLVDAGYLLHKGVEIVSNKASTERKELELNDPSGLINLLIKHSKQALGIGKRELLRIYWYDGVMSGGMTAQQRSICELPDVNFRAGLVNSKGQQKGVDSLIVTDLFELASNHAICDAALVTGDSDLAIGIELAQKKGVRIAVLGLEDHTVGVSSGQSREITDRADRVLKFGGNDLSAVMKYVPRVAITVGSQKAKHAALTPNAAHNLGPPLTDDQRSAIDAAVTAYIAGNPPPKDSVDSSTKRIDSSIDRALIFHVSTTLGGVKLTNAAKVHARECFRKRPAN